MQKKLAVLLLLLPNAATLFAQIPVTIAPQQCVWRDGDDPKWAATSLDETAWQPYSAWKLSGNERLMWVRCHLDLSSLRGVSDPGAQVAIGAAHEMFVNGQLIGAAGNLNNGYSSMRVFRWPLHAATDADTTVALRLAYRSVLAREQASVQLGNITILKALNDSMVLARLSGLTLLGICYGIVGFIGLSLLGFYVSDRSRPELLLLGVACISMAILRLSVFANAGQWPLQYTWAHVVYNIANAILPISELLFFFRLVGKPAGRIILISIAMTTSLWSAAVIVGNCLPFRFALPVLATLIGPTIFRILVAFTMVISLWGAMTAFFPVSKLQGRVRFPAAVCLTWVAADFAWFAFELTPGGSHSPIFLRWYNVLGEARGFTVLCVVIALMALLLREQRQIAEDRALLVGELQAAREIQRMLAPATLTTAPGIHVEVAFRPVREVGGDFYLCRPLGDGRQRLLLGDVSGKGTAAAMTAALIIGGAEDHNDYSPGRLLSHLDRVLRESRVGGFATCLCADVDADGMVTLCNAGHLPPYSGGREIAVPASLPLGLNHGSDAAYEETGFRLAPSEWLTILSDGVVEARNASGDLFGFERTLAISNGSAEEIAGAAERFGQEDDITVLRLIRNGGQMETGHASAELAVAPA